MMDAENKTNQPPDGDYSPSELNKIRAKSVDAIRKIREEILYQNANNNNLSPDKGLQTP